MKIFKKKDPKKNTVHVSEELEKKFNDLPKKEKRKWKKRIKEITKYYPLQKGICINCHFLCRKGTTEADTYEVTRTNRGMFQIGNYDLVDERHVTHRLACYFGIWDEDDLKIKEMKSLDQVIYSRVKILFKTKRKFCWKDKCLFWKYRPKISFKNGKILRNSEKDKLYTRLALYIAVTALVVNTIVTIITSSCNG